MNNIIQELLNFKDEIIKDKLFFLDSKIIAENTNYKNLIKSWINPNRKIKTEILYRLTKDGDSVNTFHTLCDNISPTIILVESINGYKFGGYTTLTWDNHSGNKKDGKTFLFSLNKNKLFKKRESQLNERDIYCSSSTGPMFGGGDLFFDKTMRICGSCENYFFLNNRDLADNFKKHRFDLKEVEEYKIIFEL